MPSLKCIGCDTPIPLGSTNCPMCGAKVKPSTIPPPPGPPKQAPIVQADEGRPIMSDKREVIIKTYTGSQNRAIALFQSDSATMAANGFFPTSQSWAPGSYGCGSFIVALLLCFLIIGFLVFIYMLIVKPDGTLTVTYEWRN